MVKQWEFCENITKNLHSLKESIDPKELVDRLVAGGVLTPQQAHGINAMATKYDKNGQMLEILKTRPEWEIPIILKCFQDTNQAHMADIISGKNAISGSSPADGTQCEGAYCAVAGSELKSNRQSLEYESNAISGSSPSDGTLREGTYCGVVINERKINRQSSVIEKSHSLAVIGGAVEDGCKIEVWRMDPLSSSPYNAIIEASRNYLTAGYEKACCRMRACFDNNIIYALESFDCTKFLIYEFGINKWKINKEIFKQDISDGYIFSLNGNVYVYGFDCHYRVMVLLHLKGLSEAPLILARTESEPIREFAAVCSDNYIYLAGGFKADGSKLATVERHPLDGMAHKWEPLESMQQRRSHHAAAVLTGDIYICGGESDDNKTLNSCEKYSTTDNKWYPISPMGTPRKCFSLVPCCGKLIAIGGAANGCPRGLPSMEIYCPEYSSWQTAGAMLKEGRCDHATVVFPDV